jgi:hypothetical protein
MQTIFEGAQVKTKQKKIPWSILLHDQARRIVQHNHNHKHKHKQKQNKNT